MQPSQEQPPGKSRFWSCCLIWIANQDLFVFSSEIAAIDEFWVGWPVLWRLRICVSDRYASLEKPVVPRVLKLCPNLDTASLGAFGPLLPPGGERVAPPLFCRGQAAAPEIFGEGREAQAPGLPMKSTPYLLSRRLFESHRESRGEAAMRSMGPPGWTRAPRGAAPGAGSVCPRAFAQGL